MNAQDPRVADKAIKVTKANCKVGKANILEARKMNYHKTFGIENVNFVPIARLSDIDTAEKAILDALDGHRMKGKTGRKNEWLEGIQPEDAIRIALTAITQRVE